MYYIATLMPCCISDGDNDGVSAPRYVSCHQSKQDFVFEQVKVVCNLDPVRKMGQKNETTVGHPNTIVGNARN